MKINKEEKQLEFYIDDALVKTLKDDEAVSFLSKTAAEINAKTHIFNPTYKKISIADVEKALGSIDKLTGLNFFITLYVRCFPEAHVDIALLTNEDNRADNHYGADFNMDENFDSEKMYAGQVTNHELIACLADDLIDYILDTPNFEISICGMDENIYKFFDEEEIICYEGDISYDT